MFISTAIITVEIEVIAAEIMAYLEKSFINAVTNATPAPAALCIRVLFTLSKLII